MENKFEVELFDFFEHIEEKARYKIIFNVHKARKVNDNKLFKKLAEEIWEFRTLYNRKQYRLFAFWYKSGNTKTLVVATHGTLRKLKST